MSHKARIEYLNAIIIRYQKSTRKEKTHILNEFCAVCGYSRSYAVRILNQRVSLIKQKRGRKSKYGEEVVRHLKALWELTGRICSKRLKFAIPIWLHHYRRYNKVSIKTSELLLEISPATIDRLLRPYKLEVKKGISTTKGSNWIKSNIPLKRLDHKAKHPGFIEADTVAHCGNSISGEYINTVTLTDIFSHWTENRAIWTKDGFAVLSCIKEIDQGLPFELWGYTADNGTEVLNKYIKRYFTKDRIGNKFTPTRGRPYKKNDQCYVEQKNFTHVRNLFGYDRLDDEALLPIMNEIYRVYWNVLLNYFTPTMKLISKKRVGSKIVKTYDPKLKTPAQRLLESEMLTNLEKRKIKDKLRSTNPILLKQKMEERLKQIQKIVDINNINRKSQLKLTS